MRIRRLGLDRFGPFSETSLDLSRGSPGGLHVVYGPNEAGKSTSRRAVIDLLFGIPLRTDDAHTHGARELCLSGELERAGGETLAFSRRKRRNQALTDGLGRPLTEAILAPFLLGIDRTSFLTRYALGQEELEAGARALLSGKEEGLFAAGSAGAGVGKVLASLLEQQNGLFRPRGQKHTLNVLLEQLKEAERALRSVERPAEKWQEQRRAYETKLREAEELEARRRSLRAELSRSNRYAAVLSEVTELAEAEAELEGLAQTPLLAVDATEQRLSAQAEVRDADQACRVHEAEVQLLEQRLDGFGPATSIEQGDEEHLDLLRNQRGAEVKAWSDLPKRKAALAQFDERVAEVVRSLGRDGTSAESLQVDTVREGTLQRLATEHGHLASDALQMRRGAARIQRERQELDSEIAALRAGPAGQVGSGLEGLRTTVGQARPALAEVARLADLRRERIARRAEVEALARELGREPGGRAPARSNLEGLVRRHTEQEALATELEQEVRRERAIEAASLARAELLQASLDLPSEEQLVAERRRRDVLLHAVVSGKQDGADATGIELMSAVERSDSLADRLRREAQRVSEYVNLRLEAAAARARHAAALLAHQELEPKRLALAQDYEAYFSGGPAAPPEAALRYHDAWQRLGEVAAEVQELETDIERLERLSESWRLRLVELVPDAAAESLEELALRVERWLESLQAWSVELAALERRKSILDRQLQTEEGTLAVSEKRLADWQAEWARATEPLGLGESPTIAEVQAYLSRLGELGAILRERREMRRRVEGIERDTRSFVGLLDNLVERHAPDLAADEPLQAAEILLARASRAREVGIERVRASAELERRQSALRASAQRRDAAERRLSELLQTAGAQDIVALMEVELRSTRRRELVGRIAHLESSLRGRAGSSSVRELVRQVRGLDHDRLAAAIVELEEQLAELDEQHHEATRDVASLQQGLELLGTTDASDARQRATNRRSAVEHALRDLLVLKAAHTMLAAEMAEFAARNQSSMLKGAGELFARLTLGKYQDLEAGLDTQDLRCISGDREKSVAELSKGTRAQLFFALRLASLWPAQPEFESPSANAPNVGERLPLVLDDLFVEFDDDRTVAAFEILGEFARRGQVLYFTHLARDVEAAEDAVPASHLFVHKLGS